MKKIVLVLITVLLMLSLFSLTVFADSEKESNNKSSDATTIKPNVEMVGKTGDKNDVDWYKFTLTEQGVISVKFDHGIVSSTDTYWEMRLYRADAVTPATGKDVRWDIKGNQNIETNKIGLPEGTYYILIERYSTSRWSDVEYKLTVNFEANQYTELEINNTVNEANEIELNKKYQGSLTASDTDWFKFTVPEDGAFTLSFTHDIIHNENKYWEFYYYGTDGVTEMGKVTIIGTKNFEGNYVGLAAGTYYCMIKPYSSSYIADIPYYFELKYVKGDNYEKEFNENVESATPIEPNKEYTGCLRTDNDQDWYKVEVPEAGFISAEFSHDVIASENIFWQMTFLGPDGVKTPEGYNAGEMYYEVPGNKNIATNKIGVPAGTYYIKINKRGTYSDKQYTVKFNFEANDSFEQEPNNNFESANKIEIGKIYNGFIHKSNDQDWFNFTNTIEQEVMLSFTHRKLHDSATWYILVYSFDGVTEKARLTVESNADASASIGILPAGEYYIKITPDIGWTRGADTDYTLSITSKHDCIGVDKVTREPTCTVPGIKENVCEICGKVLKSEEIPASHNVEGKVIDKEATCTLPGKYHGTCTVCGEKIEQTIGVIPHEFGEWVQVSGNKVIPPIVTERTCAVCGETESEKDWSNWWITALIVAGVIGIVIGVINYAKAFKNNY